VTRAILSGIQRFGQRSLVAMLAVVLMGSFAGVGGRQATAASASDCQTSFFVYTDPDNIGNISTNGDIVRIHKSGIIGWYTSGRFEDFTISGLQELTLNQATGKATIKGSFVATSPDQESSFTLTYTGRADLIANTANGRFHALKGTGDLKGLRASGTIAADYLGNFRFSGVDVGLC
jgi:hypothetical protein